MSGSNNSAKLRVLWGQVAHKSGTEVVRDLLGGKDKPRLAWCEPTPRADRLNWFHGLWIDNGVNELADRLSSAKLDLDEARLFWDDNWVHLVIERERVRWAIFQPHRSDHCPDRPSWMEPLGEPLRSEGQTWDVVEEPAEGEPARYLLLMGPRDQRRYGLPEGLFGAFPQRGLYVVAYRRQAVLMAWRLEVK